MKSGDWGLGIGDWALAIINNIVVILPLLPLLPLPPLPPSPFPLLPLLPILFSMQYEVAQTKLQRDVK